MDPNLSFVFVANNEDAIGASQEAPQVARTGWLGGIVKQLTGWWGGSSDNTPPLVNAQPNVDEDSTIEILDDWEWMLSRSEEMLLQCSKSNAESRSKELNVLRMTASQLRLHPWFIRKAKETFQQLSEGERHLLETSVLDSSKRSKIIADIVEQHAECWFRAALDTFLQHESEQTIAAFLESWSETPYRKGIVGSLKEVGWQASHGPGKVGLTPWILGDIIWSFWKTFTGSLKTVLGRALEQDEVDVLAEAVCGAQEPLIRLWLKTAITSRLGAENEGKVVARWRAEEARKRQEAIQAARLGTRKIDARWGGEKQPVVRLCAMDDVRKTLESKLHFAVCSRK